MKTHSKSTGEFVDLARECTTTTRTLLSLSLSLHRQIDFAITFKFSQEESKKVLPKTNPKNFHRHSR
jgi:hypothetical protein